MQPGATQRESAHIRRATAARRRGSAFAATIAKNRAAPAPHPTPIATAAMHPAKRADANKAGPGPACARSEAIAAACKVYSFPFLDGGDHARQKDTGTR